MQNGLHIHEDHFIPETIDPDSLNSVSEGETENWYLLQ